MQAYGFPPPSWVPFQPPEMMDHPSRARARARAQADAQAEAEAEAETEAGAERSGGDASPRKSPRVSAAQRLFAQAGETGVGAGAQGPGGADSDGEEKGGDFDLPTITTSFSIGQQWRVPPLGSAYESFRATLRRNARPKAAVPLAQTGEVLVGAVRERRRQFSVQQSLVYLVAQNSRTPAPPATSRW